MRIYTYMAAFLLAVNLITLPGVAAGEDFVDLSDLTSASSYYTSKQESKAGTYEDYQNLANALDRVVPFLHKDTQEVIVGYARNLQCVFAYDGVYGLALGSRENLPCINAEEGISNNRYRFVAVAPQRLLTIDGMTDSQVLTDVGIDITQVMVVPSQGIAVVQGIRGVATDLCLFSTTHSMSRIGQVTVPRRAHNQPTALDLRGGCVLSKKNKALLLKKGRTLIQAVDIPLPTMLKARSALFTIGDYNVLMRMNNLRFQAYFFSF